MGKDWVYKYRPLSTPSTIRPIRVMHDMVGGCCIACKIIYTFDIQQLPNIKYDALSYVWGNPRHAQDVYLSEEGSDQWSPYPLHENLALFLTYAWKQVLFGRLFWTDYLCLNQNDRHEIAQQVPRMGSIYSQAAQVVAWIQLSLYYPRQSLTQRRLLEILESALREPATQHAGLEDVADVVSSNEYWSRVWIVQEIATAKKVCVILGNLAIDFDGLQSILDPWRRRYSSANSSNYIKSFRTFTSKGEFDGSFEGQHLGTESLHVEALRPA